MARRPIPWVQLLGGAAIPTAMGGACLFLCANQMMQMTAKPFGAPGWLWHFFFALWLLCYPLMGTGACLVNQTAHPLRRHALVVYTAQLLINLSVIPLLFVLRQTGVALFVLLFVLLLAGILADRFWHICPAAGKLQLIYLLSICLGVCLTAAAWSAGF